MTDKVAGLTLGVDVSQVQTATKSLKDFKQANQESTKALEDFAQAESIATAKAKQLRSEQQQQAAAAKALKTEFNQALSVLDPLSAKMQKLTDASKTLDKAWQAGIIPDKEFFRLGEVIDMQNTKLLAARAALTEEGQAAAAEAAAKQKAAAAGQTFLNSLQNQVSALGKTSQELLEMKAAQLGISQQAAPLIAQLHSQSNAMGLAGVSAGQYRQAMRMLPAQITDVVTSLASGMPVWMVAIQQGGQIKDSFGGIGNTFKVLLSYLSPMKVAVAAGALAFGAMAVAIYQTKKNLDLAKTAVKDNIGLTGDYADKLALSLSAIADKSGQTADEISKTFINSTDGAQESINKLVAVGYSYDEARAKVNQYKGQSDFRVLNADLEEHRLAIEGIGAQWSQAAEDVKNYYTGANQGKQSLALGGAIDPAMRAIEAANQLQKDMKENTIAGNKAVADAVANINKQYLATDHVAGAQKELNDAIKLQKSIQDSGDKEAIANATKLVALRQKALEQAQKNANKTPKAKKTPAVQVDAGDKQAEQYQAETVALQAQLRVLQQHKTVNDSISQQQKTYWNDQAKFQVLEEASKTRSLTKSEQQLLASKDLVLQTSKQKAEIGNQILAQEQYNKRLDDSVKKVEELKARTAQNSGGNISQSDRAQQQSADQANMLADWISKGGQATDAAYLQMKKASDDYYASEEAKRSNWMAGAENAFQNFGDNAMNMYQNVGQIASNALDGMSQSLTDLVMTGKANFGDLAKSIIADIIQMTLKMAIFKAISAGMGMAGFSSGGQVGSNVSASGAGFAGGGFTGSGGKYEPKGVVHAGEFVFTKEATSRIGTKNLYRMMRGYASGGQVGGTYQSGSSGGNAVAVAVGEVNINMGGGNDAKNAKGLETGVRQIVTDMLVTECAQGGRIYNLVKGQ